MRGQVQWKWGEIVDDAFELHSVAETARHHIRWGTQTPTAVMLLCYMCQLCCERSIARCDGIYGMVVAIASSV